MPQVQTKLKLVGIEAVYLASSGERVTRLDQLQDIDELYVVEVGARCCICVCPLQRLVGQREVGPAAGKRAMNAVWWAAMCSGFCKHILVTYSRL